MQKRASKHFFSAEITPTTNFKYLYFLKGLLIISHVQRVCNWWPLGWAGWVQLKIKLKIKSISFSSVVQALALSVVIVAMTAAFIVHVARFSSRGIFAFVTVLFVFLISAADIALNSFKMLISIECNVPTEVLGKQDWNSFYRLKREDTRLRCHSNFLACYGCEKNKIGYDGSRIV